MHKSECGLVTSQYGGLQAKVLTLGSRKRSDKELKKFAEVLADNYAFDLKTLALKKPSNDQIFQGIKEKLDFRLSRAHEGGKGQVDTSVSK